MPLNHTFILSDSILHVIGSDFISLDHKSFYWIIYFMSLDRTSFHWIIRHSIGSYTSCHWIGLHFIGSYVILLDHILFMSLDQASCHCNTSFCRETTFVLLNLNSCHWIVDHSIGPYTSCHWIELHVIGSETSFHWASGLLKKVCFPESPECLQNAFQNVFRAVVLRRWCFAVWKVWP